MIGRFKSILVIVLLGLSGLPLIPGVPAFAEADASCNSEDAIFWGSVYWDGSFYHWHTFDRGNYGEITIADRDLNNTCNVLLNLAGSTSNVWKDSSPGDLIEVGYDEGWDISYSSHLFRWFYEVVVNGNPIRQNGGWGNWSPWCTFPGIGQKMGFRVTQIIGSSNWNLKINCLDGTGDHIVGNSIAASFSGGIANRETWRFGGSKTGMSDDHDGLLRRPGDYNSWTSWTSGLCLQDASLSGSNNWNGRFPSNTVYETYKSTMNSCPHP